MATIKKRGDSYSIRVSCGYKNETVYLSINMNFMQSVSASAETFLFTL